MKQTKPKIDKAALIEESDITVDSYIEDIVVGKRFVFFLPGVYVFGATMILSLFAAVALGGGIISWIRYLLTVPQQAFAEFIVIFIFRMFRINIDICILY